VVTFDLARKYRASLVGISAYGDDGVNIAIEKGIHVLRIVLRNVDSDFVEGLDRFRVDVSGWV
jgi:hypothetical protein